MSQVIQLRLRIDQAARQALSEKFDQVIGHVLDADDSQGRTQFYHLALGMIDSCTTLHDHLLPSGMIQALNDANESAMTRLESDCK